MPYPAERYYYCVIWGATEHSSKTEYTTIKKEKHQNLDSVTNTEFVDNERGGGED